ncbi:hypothetical protein BEWA_033400 [Theileria equi strain WA]|uniref:Uncharacterized protein n=1 Tax=Theileria equi strain WA TaxID=1537102 RepID=L0AY29_THEEQ|nr:hypothetical protein BEWA_033400 [Theileria equi strain WA]AFZ80487.1 hypothetical protein BEWA_033400 [Theileria equi strain WA]|eukprot:XP_004830153.1 hypothetical protein BEWA_033400 [Theileria equi strain WA]
MIFCAVNRSGLKDTGETIHFPIRKIYAIADTFSLILPYIISYLHKGNKIINGIPNSYYFCSSLVQM